MRAALSFAVGVIALATTASAANITVVTFTNNTSTSITDGVYDYNSLQLGAPSCLHPEQCANPNTLFLTGPLLTENAGEVFSFGSLSFESDSAPWLIGMNDAGLYVTVFGVFHDGLADHRGKINFTFIDGPDPGHYAFTAEGMTTNPEPGTLVLLGSGLLFLGLAAKRRS